MKASIRKARRLQKNLEAKYRCDCIVELRFRPQSECIHVYIENHPDGALWHDGTMYIHEDFESIDAAREKYC